MLVSDTLFAKPPHANKELWLIKPLAYLYHAYKSCEGFRRFLDERHGQRLLQWTILGVFACIPMKWYLAILLLQGRRGKFG